MIKLFGEKIILKEMTINDAKILNKLTKDPDLNKYSGPYMSSISLEKAKEYINNCKIKIKNKDSYCLGIYLPNKKDIIGNIGFINLDKENLNGEIGFWIGKEYWGRGYISEALKLMTNFCLYKINFKRIYVHFHQLNTAVKKVLEKNNYKLEGKLKSALKMKDKYYDDFIYGIVKP